MVNCVVGSCIRPTKTTPVGWLLSKLSSMGHVENLNTISQGENQSVQEKDVCCSGTNSAQDETPKTLVEVTE